MVSLNRPYRWSGAENAPLVSEPVMDMDTAEIGIVTRRAAMTINVWVKFPSRDDEVLYTYRSALDTWKAFPGRADALGLRPSKLPGKL